RMKYFLRHVLQYFSSNPPTPSHALIGRLFHSDTANVNQLAAEPTGDCNQHNAGNGEDNREIIARRTMHAQPEIHAVKSDREQIDDHVPDRNRFCFWIL